MAMVTIAAHDVSGRLGRIQQISESQFQSFFLFFLTVTLWKMCERPTQAVYMYCIGCRELE